MIYLFLNIEKINKDYLVAIDENDLSLSYGDLCDFVDELNLIIDKRTVVFSLCRNSIGSLAGYVGFLSNGVVPLLLSSDLDKELFDYLLKIYKPSYMWVPNNIKLQFNYDVIYEKFGYSLLKTNYEKYIIYSDLALLLTTSGSTGSPKLVRQSYENIIENAKSIGEYLELDENERPITTLPMNYTYGLSIINSHLLVGATVLLTNSSYTQKTFWEFFKSKKATSFGGVPYTYEILKKLRFFNMNLPSLKTMTQAGGKLSPELHREFAEYAKKNNKRFYVMYGQTEATARMSYLPYDKSLEKYGSMGIAIPRGEFYLIDINGEYIKKPNIVGELVYKGKNVTLGYAECAEDLLKGDERNGILITGDMAKFDEDGYYYIVGRKKRFLKIFGNRVNLDECERMIKIEFSDLDCACVGIDDKMSIYITDDKQKDNVRKFIVEKTNLNYIAFEILYIPEIPKNDSGKTLYSKLRCD